MDGILCVCVCACNNGFACSMSMLDVYGDFSGGLGGFSVEVACERAWLCVLSSFLVRFRTTQERVGCVGI